MIIADAGHDAIRTLPATLPFDKRGFDFAVGLSLLNDTFHEKYHAHGPSRLRTAGKVQSQARVCRLRVWRTRSHPGRGSVIYASGELGATTWRSIHPYGRYLWMDDLHGYISEPVSAVEGSRQAERQKHDRTLSYNSPARSAPDGISFLESRKPTLSLGPAREPTLGPTLGSTYIYPDFTADQCNTSSTHLSSPLFSSWGPTSRADGAFSPSLSYTDLTPSRNTNFALCSLVTLTGFAECMPERRKSEDVNQVVKCPQPHTHAIVAVGAAISASGLTLRHNENLNP